MSIGNHWDFQPTPKPEYAGYPQHRAQPQIVRVTTTDGRVLTAASTWGVDDAERTVPAVRGFEHEASVAALICELLIFDTR